MREEIASAQHTSGQFRALHEDSGTVWNDEAARTVEARWLGPYRESEDVAFSGMRQQADLLDAGSDEIAIGHQRLSSARDRSTQLGGAVAGAGHRVDECSGAVSMASSEEHVANEGIARSRSDVERAESLLHSASSL